MDDDRTGASRVARVALWAARALFIAAAAAVVLYLFIGYKPPRAQSYRGREKVIFWHMWTSNWAEVVERIVGRFNESQDRWEVVPLTVAGGSLKTLIASAGGDPPDCMAQWEAVIPAWAERNALTPLDTLMPRQEWEADHRLGLTALLLRLNLLQTYSFLPNSLPSSQNESDKRFSVQRDALMLKTAEETHHRPEQGKINGPSDNDGGRIISDGLSLPRRVQQFWERNNACDGSKFHHFQRITDQIGDHITRRLRHDDACHGLKSVQTRGPRCFRLATRNTFDPCPENLSVIT